MSYFFPAVAGLLTGAGLIIAIGAQNVFVLRQGIRREHVLPVVAVCTASDIVLILAGVVGWIAAFALTIEKFHALMNPDAGGASCDFSIVVQCTANLDSWQGSVFGFPNPILGLTGWVASIVVGRGPWAT